MKNKIAYVPVKSKLQHPPRATPWAFEFLKYFVQIPPSPGQKAVQMPPLPGELFSSFYYASEGVHVNMVY